MRDTLGHGLFCCRDSLLQGLGPSIVHKWITLSRLVDLFDTLAVLAIYIYIYTHTHTHDYNRIVSRLNKQVLGISLSTFGLCNSFKIIPSTTHSNQLSPLSKLLTAPLVCSVFHYLVGSNGQPIPSVAIEASLVLRKQHN
jgi:hypothetical protein